MSLTSSKTAGGIRRWAGPFLLLVAGAMLATWLLPVMPDPIVDYGREVYVPWRITEGEAIYRDIEYFNGPLSPYLHAVVFRLFGVSITTLKVFNLVLVALFTALLYRLLLEISDRLAATVGGLTFLALFGLGHMTPFAIFNWITPYSYELPHGMELSLAMITALWLHARTGRRGWLVAGGLLLGLVFLTKAEVFLSAALAGGAGVVIGIWSAGGGWRAALRRCGMFAAGAVAPVVMALGLLALIMPVPVALRGLAGSWKWVGNEQLSTLHYFQFIMGTHDTRQSLVEIATWTGLYLALLALAAAAGFAGSRLRPRSRGTAAVACAGIVAGAIYLLNHHPPTWLNITRPAPLVMTIAGVVLLWLVAKHRHDRAALARLALPMMLVVFAGALLGKILLNVRPVHYGFALAMPAGVLIVVGMLHWFPRQLARLGGSAAPARAVVLGAWSVAIFILLGAEARMVAAKGQLVGRGGDAFYADLQRALFVNSTLADIERMPTPNRTLVVMPEGLMIGYLARRVNPSGHLNFTPPAIIMFGEDRMLADLQRSSPDLIVLVHHDATDYNAQFFGKDYARQIALWINRNYHIVSRVGALPFTSDKFGILLMRRNDLRGR